MLHVRPTTSAPPAPEALLALRQATASQHARIESLLGLGGPFGRRHYDRVLQGFAAFVHAWEPRVLRALPAEARDWAAAVDRTALLARDLRALGLAWPGVGVAVQVPDVATSAQAWGSLYVLEGSALGGQLISAGLQRRLGIHPDTGGAYFHGLGAGTAGRWREYRQRCEPALATAADRVAAAACARATFEGLMATFQGLLHDRAAA